MSGFVMPDDPAKSRNRKELPPSFPFFVGTNGSGTTLHRAIFDSHPDLAIPGESHFIVPLARRRRLYEGPDGLRSGRLLGDLRKESRFLAWDLPLPDVETALSDPPVPDYPEAIRRLYALYARSRGKTRYGDKTQTYIHHLPLLAGLFPEARFVHVVRDGRDVALAHTAGTKMEQVALSWKRRVRRGRQAGGELGPSRYVESRFEELLQDPEAAVKRLCTFLELEFHPRMLEYHHRADEIVATTAKPERHRDIFRPPTQGLTDWRRELSEDQLARFEAVAADLLEELNYDLAFARVSLARRLRAWGGLFFDAGRYALRRARKLLYIGTAMLELEDLGFLLALADPVT